MHEQKKNVKEHKSGYNLTANSVVSNDFNMPFKFNCVPSKIGLSPAVRITYNKTNMNYYFFLKFIDFFFCLKRVVQ